MRDVQIFAHIEWTVLCFCSLILDLFDSVRLRTATCGRVGVPASARLSAVNSFANMGRYLSIASASSGGVGGPLIRGACRIRGRACSRGQLRDARLVQNAECLTLRAPFKRVW